MNFFGMREEAVMLRWCANQLVIMPPIWSSLSDINQRTQHFSKPNFSPLIMLEAACLPLWWRGPGWKLWLHSSTHTVVHESGSVFFLSLVCMHLCVSNLNLSLRLVMFVIFRTLLWMCKRQESIIRQSRISEQVFQNVKQMQICAKATTLL